MDSTNGSKLEQLLQPINHLSFDSESDISDIPDVFEEFHRESFLRPNATPNKKYLTKCEADRKTVERFTDDFKKTIRAVREELGVNKPLFDEESAVEEVLKGKSVVHNVHNVNLANRGSPILIEDEKDKGSVSSSESKVWQMMLANSSSKFEVTPPIFHAFRQERRHWLERPPISWKRVDESRKKCERWLDDV